MTFRLYALGDRAGDAQSGELAQLLAGNAFFQNDKVANLIKLCLETSETKSTTAPLMKATKLFMQARQEISVPFTSRSDCLQSCIYDVLLCYTSFWGQIFEYYETMYYRPVQLPDGTTDSTPANVPFETGWLITCLFIRDTMLGCAARAAGVSSGYDRSMSWFFYPANSTSELEEGKALVLTVIGKIRKRGTVLVSAEGMIGHISFSNAMPLTHWVEDNLEKDWNNSAKLAVLAAEYFESSSIRLNVNVVPVADQSGASSDDALNLSFGPETSFLDGLATDDMSPPMMTQLSASSRSVALNIRPITPAILASASCEWNGVEMGEFCREIASTCKWPEVVNTVSTVGQIGISVINMSGEVQLSESWQSSRRKSYSAPSRISTTPDRSASILPFSLPTPQGMPPLELMRLTTPPPMPQFGGGFIPIPNLTPTPGRTPTRGIAQQTPTPVHRRGRDSEVTFFGGEDDPATVSPLERAPHAGGALVALPSDADFDFGNHDGSPSKMRRIAQEAPPVATRPSVVEPAQPDKKDANLGFITECLVHAAGRDLSAKDWSVEKALGDLASRKSIASMYMHVVASAETLPSAAVNVSFDQNAAETNGRKRKKSNRKNSTGSDNGETPRLAVIEDTLLASTEKRLAALLTRAERRSLQGLSSGQRSCLRSLARVLTLASLWNGVCEEKTLKSIVAVAADLVCFASGSQVQIGATDVFATGLRSAYVEADIAMIEVAKDLALADWLTLCLYFNDVSFAVLMSPQGLFQPNVAGGSAGRNKGPHRLTGSHLNTWERLPQHCLLVCSELMMRWSWAPSSRVWRILDKLRIDHLASRHGISPDEEPRETTPEEIAELDYFVKQVLVNAGTYLCDLGDRLGATPTVLHATMDILRAAILTRPELFKARHVYHIMFCALMAASSVLKTPGTPATIEFGRIAQAAIVMQPDAAAQLITSRFISKGVLLSTCGAADMFSDCSGALVFPDVDQMPQPEFSLTGDVYQFFQGTFVGEMRQILFNIKKSTIRPPSQEGCDLGPFPEGLVSHPSLSPFAYPALSSGLALGMQQALGVSGVQFKTIKHNQFSRAMAIASPLGVLPALLPPIKPSKVSGRSGDTHYKWVDGMVIRASKGGIFSVIQE